ncbi:MAG: pelota family protein [Candidatus Altiarchaeota archaeon]|nr:pelota family protein [Candidatus Altiarchaeota archaeon]
MRTKLKKGESSLVPESLDDLWLLSEIVHIGDLVGMKTLRKVKLSLGDRSEAEKKPMFLKIKVNSVKFEEYTVSLRVSGEIVDGPEDARGNHSFSVAPGDKLNVYKDFSSMEIDLLKKAKSKQADVCLVLIDRDEAMIAHGRQRFWIKSSVASKDSDEAQDFSQFFGQVKKRLSEINPEYVVVAGPGFVKDKLVSEIEYKTILEGASSVSESGLREVFSRGALEKVGVVIREAEENNTVESIFNKIKSGKSFYGLNDSKTFCEQKNVEILVVSSNLISNSIRDSNYSDLRSLIEKVKYGGGRVMLVGKNEDATKRLDGLGGIAGIKRW